MKHGLYMGIAAMSTLMLQACGGGKVIVNPAAPVAPAVAPAVVTTAPPVASSVIVTTVPPTPAPPTLVAALGPSPGADYIRVEGYYNWLGDHYEWVTPTWVRIPRAGATYVPGHWQSVGNGFQWMPGHWQ